MNNDLFPKLLGFIYISREDSYISVIGKNSISFRDLLDMFERWIKDDPVGYVAFRDKCLTAFDFAGRGFDKEEENETNNSAAERYQ